MKNPVKRSTFRLALSAVLAALAVGTMLLSAVLPVGTYFLPCVAGVFMAVILTECGGKWALGAYLVSAVLSLIFAYDKEAVFFYIAFFGYYPVIRQALRAHISKGWLRLLLSLLIFNAACVASFFAGLWLLSVPVEEYTLFGVYVPWIFLLLGNVLFLLYDRALTAFLIFYERKLRNKLLKRR